MNCVNLLVDLIYLGQFVDILCIIVCEPCLGLVIGDLDLDRLVSLLLSSFQPEGA